MDMTFFKYHGAGNDFIFIDNRNNVFPKKNTAVIRHLCDRHFGIGADGLILLENDSETDFKMIYFNADSSQTMCGNGGRCAVAFAKKLNIIETSTTFSAFDGLHYAEIKDGTVSLQMIDVDDIKITDDFIFTNTGTPHHVEIVEDLKNYPVFKKGKEIRYDVYGKEGSNVNFVQQVNENTFQIRTYERGVEDETLACGTGVTAVAVAMHAIKKVNTNTVHLLAEGGKLKVHFDCIDGTYKNVVLSGPAEFVFKGTVTI